MAKPKEPRSAGVVGWALRKVAKAPAAWLGAVAGVVAGVTIAGVSGVVAGFLTGALFGVGFGIVSQGVSMAIRSAHSLAGTAASRIQRKRREEQELLLVEKLKASGLTDDADVITKMLEARNAILKRCGGPDVSSEISAPTLELVEQITRSALHRSEELLDLTLRLEDPHLDAPAGAADTVVACRADLVRAYRAVADSRTRILLHKEASIAEVLDERSGVRGRGLGTLAERLEEETAVLQGIDRRLRSIDARTKGAEPEVRDGGYSTSTTHSPELESES